MRPPYNLLLHMRQLEARIELIETRLQEAREAHDAVRTDKLATMLERVVADYFFTQGLCSGYKKQNSRYRKGKKKR